MSFVYILLIVCKNKDTHVHCFTQKRYFTVPQLRGDGGSHGHQGEHDKKHSHHGELQQVQRRKRVTTSHYETAASPASVSQHRASMPEHRDVHEQYKVSFGQQEVVIPLDPNDPALKSQQLDYVNLPLGEGYVNYTVPHTSEGQTSYRVPKPTKASLRSASMGTASDTSLLPPSNTPKTTSMPELHSYTDERDGICQEAVEVVATGDERHDRFTSSETPFLECLYCYQGFGYGEIQEYRKHVNTCTESV